MEVIMRTAVQTDVSEISRLALELSLQHQKYDDLRFYLPEDFQKQAADLFVQEIADPNCAVLVAEDDGQILGYAFIRWEAASLIELSDARTWLHDIYVSKSARGGGIGKTLLEYAIVTARAMGSSVLMLQVAEKNEFAQKLFARHNFRTTMYEMTLDLSEANAVPKS